MKRAALISIAVALTCIGCASKPEKISAAYVSPNQYANYDCEQIATETAHIERRANQLYQQLSKEAKADQWQMGVGLILLWPVLFALEGGDGPEATEYAQLQGEYEALRTVSVAKKCDIKYQENLRTVVKNQAAAEKAQTD